MCAVLIVWASEASDQQMQSRFQAVLSVEEASGLSACPWTAVCPDLLAFRHHAMQEVSHSFSCLAEPYGHT